MGKRLTTSGEDRSPPVEDPNCARQEAVRSADRSLPLATGKGAVPEVAQRAPTPCRALYVHVPFCWTVCGYCDFYSQVLEKPLVPPLVDALRRELDRVAGGRGARFDTVFVGGGTPTALPPDQLALLLGSIRAYLAPGAVEFTVEANPATVSRATAATLAEFGVNRVSVGAQSFAPDELRRLDRTHKPEHVGLTIRRCREAGLSRFSIDLIFGIPEQTLVSWRRNLRMGVELGVEHMSCYGLTYEPGTPLRAQLDAGQVERVDEELEAQMYEATIDELAAAGLPQYEISNFAAPAAWCRHNLRYWHNEPYLGIGPSAVSFVDEVRYRNVADTAAYVKHILAGESPRVEVETLPPERRARETAMLELRLVRGIERERFLVRFGVDPLELFAPAIAAHAAGGRLTADEQGIRLTRSGFLVADRVIADFL